MKPHRLVYLVILFVVAALPLFGQNLLTNGKFASGIGGWQESTNTDHVQWNSGESRSGGGGSIWLFAIGSESTIEVVQCVSGIAPGATFQLSGSMYFTLFDNDGVGTGSVGLRGYSGSSCNGSTTIDVHDDRGSSSTNSWFDHTTGDVVTSPGTMSVEAYMRITTPGGTYVSAYFDDMSLIETAPPAPTSDIKILGPTEAQPGDYRYFAAVGTDCTGSTDFGWVWTAPGAEIRSHMTYGRVLIRLPAVGAYTITAAHPNCGSAMATHVVSVATTGARVGVFGPVYMYQPEGTALGSSGYSVRNYGDEPTTITLDQNGSFFSQSPASFTLQPGEWQRVSLSGLIQPLGLYRGRSFLLGSGVPTYLDEGVVVQLFVFDPADPYGQAEPLENRVDGTQAGPLVIRFRNPDPFSSTIGYIVSDVPWIVPPEGTVTIPAGSTADVSLTIDRSRRPDSAAPLGSVTGSVLFTQPSNEGSGKRPIASSENGSTPATSLVTVVDTAPPAAGAAGIPALGENETALFVPGVGHLVGSVGTFISDLSIVNRDLFTPLEGLDLYFNPASGSSGMSSQKSSVTQVSASGSLVLADLVSTVYGQDSQLGSLQIRSANIDNVGVTATVFNKSNQAGTFGTTIPVFRSDRSAGPAGKIYLTGLTKTASRHTNLFLQETSGVPATATTQFLGASGSVLGTRTDAVPPFGVIQLQDVAPEGTVTAVVENTGSAGRFAAFATPVDRLSGDTWAVSDWPQQLGYTRSEPVVVPVVGAVHGALETFFRTDVAILSTGTTSATGVLRYFDRSGPTYEETITVGPMNTRVFENITSSLFGIEGDTVGHMTYTPTSGESVMTSRNFTTVADGEATFGSGVPTLALASSLAPGDIVHFAGVSDAAVETIQEGAPATFRTNFGLVETAGEAVTIRVVVRFAVPQTLVSEIVEKSQTYDLAPNQFMLIGNLVRTILGAAQDEIVGDLSNVDVRFEHIAGTGRAAVFTSSVDNGTGDSILRVE